jgi:hypothetical protein
MLKITAGELMSDTLLADKLHTGTHLITKVKQCRFRLVLERLTAHMTSMTGAVRRCTRIL